VGIVGIVGRVGFVRCVGVVCLLGFLVDTMPAFAQVRRIQGKVVDDQGQGVPGALIEAAIVSIADVDFGVTRTDQIWRARTNASGDYILTVPIAGEYLVKAAKEGIGSDQIKVAVQRSGLVTANLTLWKLHFAAPAPNNCGTSNSIGAFERSALSAGAHPGLSRLLGWLEAVHLHTPGCSDPSAAEMGRLAPDGIEILLRDVRELMAFLRRIEAARAESDRLIFFIYERRFTIDELQRQFFGNHALTANELLLRAAVMHADVAIFVPGDFGRHPLVADGGRRGWRGGSLHWEAGRRLLDDLSPDASDGALFWYRAIAAHLFRTGNLAELSEHLMRARQVFPRSVDLLFDSGCLHHEMSSPAIQASLQQLHASNVSVNVGSRVAEVRRAERFFRDTLAVAPGHAGARVRLGHTLGALGRHKEAAAELKRALDAKPDVKHVYLAELLLGREEESLGRHDDARHRYGRAAGLYPQAQSPQLALSRLAQHTGDRASARRALQTLAAVDDINGGDPWWGFYQPHKEDADVLMARMRQIGR
jgi:tetratricopeptide (TPR) repeat protein